MLLIEDEEVALDFDIAINLVHRAERESRIAAAVEMSNGDPMAGLLRAAIAED